MKQATQTYCIIFVLCLFVIIRYIPLHKANLSLNEVIVHHNHKPRIQYRVQLSDFSVAKL